MHIGDNMAPNRGDTAQEDDYPSSDNDSFKSFEPDSPTSTREQEEPRTTQKEHPTSSEPTASTTAKANPPIAAEEESSSSTSKANTTTIPHPGDRFPPEEEASLLAQSNTEKTSANALFGTGSYENAVQTYDRALALCPNYLDYEVAVLRSNVSACYLKLSEWKESAEAASKGLDCLERLEKLPVVRAPQRRPEGKEQEAETEVIEEVDDELEARIENLHKSGRSIAEVRKLQVKMLMRRAKAKTEQGGWANLQAADEDYRILLSPAMEPALSPTDKRSVMENARALGPKLNVAKEQEMAEMMGKLKGLGNTFLKPFGLSTENFKFEQDAKTGGYSMNFDQNAGKKR